MVFAHVLLNIKKLHLANDDFMRKISFLSDSYYPVFDVLALKQLSLARYDFLLSDHLVVMLLIFCFLLLYPHIFVFPAAEHAIFGQFHSGSTGNWERSKHFWNVQRCCRVLKWLFLSGWLFLDLIVVVKSISSVIPIWNAKVLKFYLCLKTFRLRFMSKGFSNS